MKKALFILAPFVLFLCITAFTSSSWSRQSPLDGSWTGEFTGNAGAEPFETHFWSEIDELKGTIDFPQEKAFGLELSWIIIESSAIHFEVTRNSRTLVFEGKLINNKLIGEFKEKNEHGTFDLTRN